MNPKVKKYKLFFLIRSTTILTTLVVAIFITNNFLLNVIVTNPITVNIYGLDKLDAGQIKIFGYSPNNKYYGLSHNAFKNCWELNNNICLKNMFINAPASVLKNIKLVKVQSGLRVITINEIQYDKSTNSFELTEFIKARTSRADIVALVFHPEVSVYLIALLIIILIYFGNIIYYFKKDKTVKKGKVLFWSIIILGFVFHLLFYNLTKVYLITSGVFLIIFLFLTSFGIIKIFERYIKKNKDYTNIFLLNKSVALLLIVIEIIFISTGYKTTSAERRSRYYYNSKYIPTDKNWFHLWQSDHDLVTSEFCFHRTLNAERLSDVDHDVNKKENEYRIIGIGDSFTEGDGADSDSTWLKFLERSLQKQSLKKEITFINAGVSGSDPFFEYVLLKEKLLKYKPDIVILTTNFSDIEDILIRGGMERFQKNGTLKYNNAPLLEPLFACSHISRLVFSALNYDELLMKKNEKNENYYTNKIYHAISLFYKLSISNNFKFIVVFHPMKQEIIDNKLALSSVLNEVKSNTKINYLDLLTYYRENENINETSCSELYWKNDGHHNAKGYKLFARGVEWKFKELGIIDSLKLE